jgi:hypothetical protein
MVAAVLFPFQVGGWRDPGGARCLPGIEGTAGVCLRWAAVL